MLALAINAGIPIVTCRTTDLLNLPEVLEHITAKPQQKLAGAATKIAPNHATLYVSTGPIPVDKGVYESYLAKDSTLLLVNPDEDIPLAFDAGEVPVPLELMEHYLSAVTEEVGVFIKLAAGLTIKEAVEIIKLAQAKYGTLTPDGFREIRARVAGGQQGLSQVPTDHGFYRPAPQLVEWVTHNGDYFLAPKDPRLIPRGLLFDGPPGTGKTRGAKYLAEKWGLPLYRLDLSSTLGKYVGESEGNLTNLLNTIDREEPCILLLDEVEKLFGERDDSGVTSRLLSQLLWWLQEHTSRVLTVMTTNDKKALPPELIRAGRIDTTISMDPLDKEDGKVFAREVLAQFIPYPEEACTEVLDLSVENHYVVLKGCKVEWPLVAHAELIALVHDLIKAHKWV